MQLSQISSCVMINYCSQALCMRDLFCVNEAWLSEGRFMS